MAENSYIGYKFKVYPTPQQEAIFKDYFGACRYVYNLGIDMEEEHYKQAKNDDSIEYKVLSSYALGVKFTQLKKEDKYKWLCEYNFESLKGVLRDVVNAYKMFFKKLKKYPKRKKKKNSRQMFPVRSDRLSINTNTVRIPSIGIVYCDNHNHPECIGNGCSSIKRNVYKPYCNARVIYDGY